MSGLMRKIEEVADDDGTAAMLRFEVWQSALSQLTAERLARHLAMAPAGPGPRRRRWR